jgi:hypothetical protein
MFPLGRGTVAKHPFILKKNIEINIQFSKQKSLSYNNVNQFTYQKPSASESASAACASILCFLSIIHCNLQRRVFKGDGSSSSINLRHIYVIP